MNCDVFAKANIYIISSKFAYARTDLHETADPLLGVSQPYAQCHQGSA